MSGARQRPESLTDSDFAEQTWNAMNVLLVLLEHGGFLSTAEIGLRAEVGRDACRRILRTFAAREWVRKVPDEREAWMLGPELPRIGHLFAEQLAGKNRILRADFDRLSDPFSR